MDFEKCSNKRKRFTVSQRYQWDKTQGEKRKPVLWTLSGS